MPHVSTNGIRMFYEERGSGPPLVCIMGITAPGSVWELHAAHWQQDFRCILADNRGVGATDMPPGPYTSEQMADDYAGLLDALHIDQAHVIGCSMGSTVAQQLMLRHPNRVRSAVLMCPWARCDRYGRGVFEHLVHIKPRLTPAEFMNYIQLLIFAKPHWDDDASYEGMLAARTLAAQAAADQPFHALASQAAACVGHNVLDQLRQIACPTLVIGGTADIFTPRWMAEEIAERISACDIHLYEGAGHAFHWERIEDFNPRVTSWFKAH
jgi:pimeloyl-ACP methyl ester carboxylesterase